MFEAEWAKDRTRLFISYAVEDSIVAVWLARKLMSIGYWVWLDKYDLFGGCTWPDNIDDAIKNKSFRMIHLLSKHSITKPNPSAERQLGLAISKEIPNFLIPLNIDGVDVKTLPWQLFTCQYISFQDWHVGFSPPHPEVNLDYCVVYPL